MSTGSTTGTRVAQGRDGLLALRGEDLGRSAWRQVTQQMIDAFADLTGDHEWLHVDPVRAGAGPYGRTVAHGFLTLSLVPMAMTSLLTVTDVRLRVNYGLNRVRFPAPVPVDSRLRGHVVVTDVVENDDVLDLITTTTLEVEGGTKPACVAEMIARHWL